jgi:hypothetical protein
VAATTVDNAAGRELLVRLRVSEKAQATLRVTGRGATLVDRRGWVLPGTNRLGVQIPASAGKGNYDLSIGLADSARHRLTLHGGVLVPALTRKDPCLGMATCVDVQLINSVAGAPDGTGRVTSSPSGLDCMYVDGHPDGLSACGAIFRSLTETLIRVGFKAVPADGTDVLCPDAADHYTRIDTTCTATGLSVSGRCEPNSSEPRCVDLRHIAWDFLLKRFTLTVTRNGFGSGVVVGSGSRPTPYWRGSIKCHTRACKLSDVPYGARFTLVAKPDPGSIFLHWLGACASRGETCLLPITQDTTTTATFARPQSPKP